MATLKLGTQTGSLFNHLMSNGSTAPEVGKGATVLHWTDRSAYFVTWVSEDKKRCKIERPICKRADKNGMSDDQDWIYEIDPTAQPIELKFTYGKWRDAETKHIYNIRFGFMSEYYDYSF